jgi:hypothetical protein
MADIEGTVDPAAERIRRVARILTLAWAGLASLVVVLVALYALSHGGFAVMIGLPESDDMLRLLVSVGFWLTLALLILVPWISALVAWEWDVMGGMLLIVLGAISVPLCVGILPLAAKLARANLRDANLSRANLDRSDLSNANLCRVNLQHANLEWADLRSANLHGANLPGAVLKGADLGVADLRGANLKGANLQGAHLAGAKVNDGTVMPQGWEEIVASKPEDQPISDGANEGG